MAETSELPPSKVRDEIIREAKRLEESTLFSMKGHHTAASGWSTRHLWLGLPVVIISALVGAATFSQYAETYPEVKVVAGLLSLAVAILSGITTFLNPNDKESAHLTAAHAFDKLNNEARLFWAVDCWQDSPDAVLTSQLKELIERKNQLNGNSPQVPKWAYKKAKAGIVAGEAKFEVDNPGVLAALPHQAQPASVQPPTIDNPA